MASSLYAGLSDSDLAAIAAHRGTVADHHPLPMEYTAAIAIKASRIPLLEDRRRLRNGSC